LRLENTVLDGVLFLMPCAVNIMKRLTIITSVLPSLASAACNTSFQGLGHPEAIKGSLLG
jgi:hypothetical protein